MDEVLTELSTKLKPQIPELHFGDAVWINSELIIFIASVDKDTPDMLIGQSIQGTEVVALKFNKADVKRVVRMGTQLFNIL